MRHIQDFRGDSWFDAAIKTTREILKARIISSDNDQLAVVFYGTVGTNSVAHISPKIQPGWNPSW